MLTELANNGVVECAEQFLLGMTNTSDEEVNVQWEDEGKETSSDEGREKQTNMKQEPSGLEQPLKGKHFPAKMDKACTFNDRSVGELLTNTSFSPSLPTLLPRLNGRHTMQAQMQVREAKKAVPPPPGQWTQSFPPGLWVDAKPKAPLLPPGVWTKPKATNQPKEDASDKSKEKLTDDLLQPYKVEEPKWGLPASLLLSNEVPAKKRPPRWPELGEAFFAKVEESMRRLNNERPAKKFPNPFLLADPQFLVHVGMAETKF